MDHQKETAPHVHLLDSCRTAHVSTSILVVHLAIHVGVLQQGIAYPVTVENIFIKLAKVLHTPTVILAHQIVEAYVKRDLIC